MTGLYNYRYLQERLADEVERAERRGQRLCLMMADIDNFKTYNDTFGHLRGDEVLRDMALLLQENVRQMDVVTRYGGDEFMIILPETDRDEALSIAERIRLRVGSWGLQAGLGPSAGEIGVSIGIAVYPDDAESADLLIDKVDKALYRAKEFREVGISFLYTDGGKG
jgi:diguanylate cyclase (GGDEF)-like protein